MIGLPRGTSIAIAREPVDMRLGHDGLVALVRHALKLNPFEPGLFVFFGKSMDRVKILFFERGGFVLFYKRLEKGRFHMPPLDKPIDATTLTMVLDGIDVRYVRRPEVWQPPPPSTTAAVDNRA
jgi:transposase